MAVLSYFSSGTTTEAGVLYCVTGTACTVVYQPEPARSYVPSQRTRSRDGKWRWWHEYIRAPVCVFAERVVSQVLFNAIDFINTSESFVQKRRMKRKRFILSMVKKHE